MKIILGPETGQVVKDGKIISRQFIAWCEICLTKRVRNHQRLTKEDKKYVDSCEMKDWSGTDKLGNEIRGKMCKRCKQSIVLTEDGKWKEPIKA